MRLPRESGLDRGARDRLDGKGGAGPFAQTPLGVVAVAAAFVAVAAALRFAMPALGTRVAFLTFYPAVALAALFGGLWAGLLATALSGLLADYFWIPPTGSLAIHEPVDQLSLAIFCLSGAIVSLIAERLRRADRAAQRAEAGRREEIEGLVQQRTAELVAATDALQAEIVRRRSVEDKFRQVIESAPTPMIVVGAGGAIELANLGAQQIFGYSRGELVGRPVDALLPERFRAAHGEHRAAYFAEPKRRPMGAGRDLFARRRDGVEFPVEVGLSPLTTADGPKVISSIVDISARRGMEKALGDSERQMRLMFDSIRDHAIVLLDVEGRVVSWNAGAERLVGYGKDEIIGRRVALFYPIEDDAEELARASLAAAAEQGRFEAEGWRRRKDGARFMASETVNAIRDAEGALRGFVTVMRDVTERKQIERQLAETNVRFAMAAEAAGLGFWEYDLQRQTARWDDQMFVLYDRPKEQGVPDYALWTRQIHPDDRARVEAEIREALAGRRPYRTEFRILRADGGVRQLSAAGRLDRDSTARATRMFGVVFDVTERRNAERELAETNQRFAVAAEAAGLGFWDYDVAAQSLRWDDQMFRLFGRSRGQGALGYALWRDLLHPDDRARAEAEVREGFTGRRDYLSEYRILLPDGGVRHLSAAGRFDRDSSGRATRMFGVVFDVTERRKMERELTESNQRFAVAAAAAGLGFWDFDVAGQSLRWDEQMFRLYGVDPLEGAQPYALWTRHLHPADLARAEQQLRDAVEGVRSFDTEFRIVRPDGETRHIRAAASFEPAAADGGRRMLGVNFDITDARRTESELTEANERFALAAEAAGLGFWDFDIATGTSRWDDQMYRLYGLDRADGEQGFALRANRLHPQDVARVEAEIADAIAGIRSFESEYRIVRPDRRVRHLRSAASLKRDPAGRAERLLGVTFDITERKEAEQGLEQARDAAEAANRSKSDFLAVMSHEIRTPMNGVMGMNALLLDTDLTPAQRRMTEAIRDSAESLLTIIDDVLDISKLESGKIELDEIDFELPAVIEGAVDLLAPRARQKGLALSLDMNAVARTALHGDAARLRQIVLNLLSNAIKFTPHGAVGISVAASDAADGGARLRCVVTDSGPGVSAEAKKRLFKPFEQADSSISRRFGGTGLGLSICKRLIELMGGRIGVDDRPDGGSAFWFEVVLRPAPPGAAERLASNPESIDGAAAVRSGHILLAEDNAINIDVASLILTSAGYRVDVAVDGLEAIAAVGRERYDLVLMDMQMPRLDGLSATREIRAKERAGAHLPIIAMTANAMKEDRRRCLEAGMDDYFSKPFRPALLIEKVARWIDRCAAPVAPAEAAAPEPVDRLPVIDAAAVEDLAACLPPARLEALLSRFVGELDGQAARLARPAPDAGIEAIAHEAHKLASSAGTFGARQVQKLAADLEAACLAGDEAAANALIARILAASAAASTAFRARFGSAGG